MKEVGRGLFRWGFILLTLVFLLHGAAVITSLCCSNEGFLKIENYCLMIIIAPYVIAALCVILGAVFIGISTNEEKEESKEKSEKTLGLIA